MTRPLILVANDDGIFSNGIRALAKKMADLGEVIVVAPDRERSATGHAFTLDRPLRCEEIEPNWFSVDGTPADCVYIGLIKICPRRPSLVISGINHGYNLGSDLFYSGTVAGAVEAALRDVPAIAMSMEWNRAMRKEGAVFEPAARFAHALGAAVIKAGLPTGTLLNVNVPNAARLRGFKWTRLGRRVYREQVDERNDLRGRRYYWIGGPSTGYDENPGTDCHAIQHSWVSISPVDLDLTHAGLLEKIPDWTLEGFDAAVSRDLDKFVIRGGGDLIVLLLSLSGCATGPERMSVIREISLSPCLPMEWPVSAPVSSGFGWRDGRPHEGVDLAVGAGTPVRAACDGFVAYSGDRVRGYGRLVILQHDADLSTVYAHNETLLVRAGEAVQKGQVIAHAGQTGNASAPHVHFEVRQGGRPSDPRRFLEPARRVQGRRSRLAERTASR